jgi:uncharacterized protein (DUF433 family)
VTKEFQLNNLIGVGVYTPAEAGRLLHIRPAKISRWLRGHRIKNQNYPSLWTPEVNLGDDHVFLGFRDLMEVRVADAFIRAGVSAQRVRAAIILARDVIGQERPLSTNRFRTDGREIFVSVIETGEDGEERERLLNLFKRQYEFKGIIEPILKTVDFGDDGNPLLWWPSGRRMNVVVDPSRAFGQPIEAASSVPTVVLAAAARQEGVSGAARAYAVPEAAIRRAIEFEASLEHGLAA